MTDSLTRRVSQPEHVLLQEVNGESVLVNLNTEHYFGLDDVGTSMWAALTSSPSIHHAYERLLAEYAVAPDQLRRDLLELLQQLVEHGLVQLSEA